MCGFSSNKYRNNVSKNVYFECIPGSIINKSLALSLSLLLVFACLHACVVGCKELPANCLCYAWS